MINAAQDDRPRQIPWVDDRLRAWGAWARCGKPVGPASPGSCLQRPFRAANAANRVWDSGLPAIDVPAEDEEAIATDRAIGALSQQHKRLVVYRYHWQLTVHQIGKRMHRSTATIDRWIVKAQAELSGMLDFRWR